MTTAYRDAVSVAPDTTVAVVLSDGGEARLELLYHVGRGEEPVLLNTFPVPTGRLAQVGELLVRAVERSTT